MCISLLALIYSYHLLISFIFIYLSTYSCSVEAQDSEIFGITIQNLILRCFIYENGRLLIYLTNMGSTQLGCCKSDEYLLTTKLNTRKKKQIHSEKVKKIGKKIEDKNKKKSETGT